MLPGTLCQRCDRGQYAPAGSTACTECAHNTMDSDANPSTPCVECPSGWVSLVGWTACSPTSTAGAPPVGYVVEDPTATTVQGLGRVTCSTGYFASHGQSAGVYSVGGSGSEPFAYFGCEPCTPWAHIVGWGGGTCTCPAGSYGIAATSVIDGVVVTDCTPCPGENTVTAPCPGAVGEHADNTLPSPCICAEGFVRTTQSSSDRSCVAIEIAPCDMATLEALTGAECAHAHGDSLVPDTCAPWCRDAFVGYWTRCRPALSQNLGPEATAALAGFAVLCEGSAGCSADSIQRTYCGGHR